MLKTYCCHCIFSIKTNGIQTGCKLNRLDKFNKELVDNSYILDGLCRYCANCYSSAALSDDPVAAILKENEITYDVLCEYDGNMGMVDHTINSAIGEYQPQSVVVCMENKEEYSVTDLYSRVNKDEIKVIITQSFEEELFSTFQTGLQKCRSDYVYFCEVGKKIDKNCIIHLNSCVNDDLKTVYLIAGKDFTIVYRKLLEAFIKPDMKNPMSLLYNSLINHEKFKDGVISW